jgi:hypothetical protein
MASEALSEPDLSDLHDAQLLSLGFEWESGDVRLDFDVDDGSSRIPVAGSPAIFEPKRAGPATVIVRDGTEIRTSRVFEWGASVYVNEACWMADESLGLGTLRIEMQSGDVISVTGRTVEVGGTLAQPSGNTP